MRAGSGAASELLRGIVLTAEVEARIVPRSLAQGRDIWIDPLPIQAAIDGCNHGVSVEWPL